MVPANATRAERELYICDMEAIVATMIVDEPGTEHTVGIWVDSMPITLASPAE